MDPSAVDRDTRDWVLQEFERFRVDLLHLFVQLAEKDGLVMREIVIAFDTPNQAAHSGSAQTLNAPTGTVKTGDRVLLLPPSPGNRGIRYHATDVAPADDQVTLQWFNADTVALDHASMDFRFFVFHSPSGL